MSKFVFMSVCVYFTSICTFCIFMACFIFLSISPTLWMAEILPFFVPVLCKIKSEGLIILLAPEFNFWSAYLKKNSNSLWQKVAILGGCVQVRNNRIKISPYKQSNS